MIFNVFPCAPLYPAGCLWEPTSTMSEDLAPQPDQGCADSTWLRVDKSWQVLDTSSNRSSKRLTIRPCQFCQICWPSPPSPTCLIAWIWFKTCQDSVFQNQGDALLGEFADQSWGPGCTLAFVYSWREPRHTVTPSHLWAVHLQAQRKLKWDFSKNWTH